MMDRLARVEFFAVLPAGFLILVVICVVTDLSFSVHTEPVFLGDRLQHMVVEVQDKPGMMLFVLFGAYLCGSVLRVLPVKWVERIIPPFKSVFPATEKIIEFRHVLRENPAAFHHDLTDLPEVPEIIPMAVFNHWKNLVCMNSSEGFRLYQSFEARSRFFAGMFWAGFFGIAGWVWLVVYSEMVQGRWHLLIPSVILVIVFGSQFRRVRAQESLVLFSVYSGMGHERKKHANTSLRTD